MKNVGVYETKTITRHGADKSASNVNETIAGIRVLRRKFAGAFKGVNTKELIEEGRR